ncbi:MAG TPA: ABC transporter permease, partial [Caulobacteraceae bacterium]
MRSALLVAVREFRQILSTRGFWVMLLIVPVAITVSAFASTVFAPQTSSAYSLVDASGRYGAAIERRLELNYQREALRNLSTYVDRWKLGSVDPGAVWARRDAFPTDAAVAQFIAEGASAAALRRLQPHVPASAPAFKPPRRAYVEIAPPRGVPTGQGPEAFGRAITAPMQNDVVTPEGKRPFGLAVYLPKDFGAPGSVARIWTNGRASAPLIDAVRQELTQALRHGALQGAGLSADAAARIETLTAPIQVTEPPPGAGRGVIVTRSIVPLALVYLLLMTAMTTGGMMLQGVIEERSNKLLESVLACIRPADLMHGKLLGLGGVGLTVVAVWTSCAVAAAMLIPGGIVADLLRPSLTALDQPWIVAALIFYFLSGY